MSDHTALLPATLAARIQAWAELATAGDLKAARAIYNTLTDHDNRSIPRPKGDDGKGLIDFDLWKAALNWKGGQLVVRYWAHISDDVIDGVIDDELHAHDKTPDIDVRTIYLERLKKPHMARKQGYTTIKEAHEYRVLSGIHDGNYITAENMEQEFNLDASDAVDAALNRLHLAVEDAERKLQTREAELARATAIVKEWAERHGL